MAKPLREKGRGGERGSQQHLQQQQQQRVEVESFEELGLEEEMMAAMREAGISKLTEIQCVGVHAVLERRRNWLRWIVRIEFELVNGLEELTIAAPALELLWWSDAFDPSYALFGDVRVLRLQQLTTFAIPVYGRYDYALLLDYVMLLRHFPVVSRLDLRLNYERELSHYEYLMEIITRLPNIKILSLWLQTKGHALGASVFHLLRICPGIRKLQLTLLDDFMVDTPCTSICACVQQSHWSTGYSLDVLEEVEIRNFRGTDHDFAFVDVLLDMPTPIKKITITFHHLACPSEKLCKEFRSVGIPGTCFEVHRGTSEVLYEPPSSLFPKTPDDHCD